MNANTPPDFKAMRLELEEARDAMHHAIELHDTAKIENIFARVKHILAEATGSEIIYYKLEKNVDSQRAAHELRVDAECLLGEFLINLEEKKLRYKTSGKAGGGKKWPGCRQRSSIPYEVI